MIYLKYSRTGSEEQSLSTAAPTVTIGTSPTNTLLLDGPTIKEWHAKIDAKTLCITAAKLIKINDEETASQILENGDTIVIDDWTLRFFHTDEEYVNERDTRTIKVGSAHHAGPR